MSLAAKGLLSALITAVVIAALIFLAAGTIYYWEAWIFLLIFTVGSLLTTIYLIQNDPDLLKRRLRGGPTAEKRPAQRLIMVFVSLAFMGLLLVPGLDHRYGWSAVGIVVVTAGDVLVAIGIYFTFLVYRTNTYTSATIEIAANQKVIESGPYGVVRHPMYASALLWLVGTPLALRSYWGLMPAIVVIPLLIWRLVDEEKALSKELGGYRNYQQRVRYRLVPGVW